MATVVGATVPTLVDVAKRLDPNGSIATIAELLTQTNEVLLDMPWYEGNLPTGERSTVRTGLPTPTWRVLNAGVAATKSTTAQVDEAAGLLEAWSVVDCEIARLNGNIGEFRLSEATAHVEAMNQEFASVLFYGNSGLNPEKFTGLSPRYASLSSTVASSQNTISAAGSGGDNTSIWLIVWGTNTVKGIYPKGSTAGLQRKDLGEQVVQTSTTIGAGQMLAFMEQFVWKGGISVKDWRYAVRCCNIDVSDLVANSAPPDLTFLMSKMIHRIPNMGMGRPVFYMNRTVAEFLDIQRQGSVSTGGGITFDNVDGVYRPSFRGIPIRTTDALLNSETAVS